MKNALVIFCDDFRVKDNPALFHAASNHENIIAFYVYDENYLGRKIGAAAKVFLHHLLISFEKLLKKQFKTQLVIRSGDSLEQIEKIVKEAKIDAIYFNKSYIKKQIETEKLIKKTFSHLKVESFQAKLLFDPNQIKTGQNDFFKVFTPFWKNCLANENLIGDFLPIPKIKSSHNLDSVSVESLNLLPKNQGNWHEKIIKNYEFDYEKIIENIANFLDTKLEQYGGARDIPSLEGTSKISPYLRFGVVSPRMVFCAAKFRKHHQKFLSELGWREFAYYIAYHKPDLAKKEIKPEFANFKWQNNHNFLHKWQYGKTGFKLVDAGMRELIQTGVMHNRIRMLTASFLIKHLLIDWRAGEEWFWQHLVDACPAINPFSWQWVFGSGYDAAPYFRIFSPYLQKEKFDKEEKYCKKYLGKDYNLEEIVNHDLARKEALLRYKEIKTN